MKDNSNDLIKLIQVKFSSLSKGQKLISEYIMKHHDKAAFMTAAKLGKEIGVSESTVVRFAKILGFSGYPHLQKALQDLIKDKLTTVQRISLDENLLNSTNVYKKVLKADMQNLGSTIEEIDSKTFEIVVDSILNAKRIYILGLRSSSALAGYLGFYLDLILDNVKVLSFGMGEIFEQLLRVTENDLIIGISYPRYSKKTLDALKFAKKQNCKIVGITDSYISPVSNISDYTLIAKSNMISFVDSLVAPMSLINSLIIAIGIKEKNEVTSYFEKIEDIWDEFDTYETRES